MKSSSLNLADVDQLGLAATEQVHVPAAVIAETLTEVRCSPPLVPVIAQLAKVKSSSSNLAGLDQLGLAEVEELKKELAEAKKTIDGRDFTTTQLLGDPDRY